MGLGRPFFRIGAKTTVECSGPGCYGCPRKNADRQEVPPGHLLRTQNLGAGVAAGGRPHQ